MNLFFGNFKIERGSVFEFGGIRTQDPFAVFIDERQLLDLLAGDIRRPCF